MILSALLITGGVVLLFGGGELLVSGAKSLALRFSVSPLVIGLTIVAFATSCPELAATVTAALRGSTDMALGNAIGSNIANIGLILGISTLIYPLVSDNRFLRREVAFMTLATLLMYPVLLSGTIERWHGVAFLGVLGAYLYTLLRDPDSGAEEVPPTTSAPAPEPTMSALRAVLAVAGGVAMLVGGAQALVTGAADIARAFGIGERVIGLTLVAVGTSLPELATSIVAARRREADIILGNIIGSNIFNLLFILGITALVHPLAVPSETVRLDFWMMLGTSLAIFVLIGLWRELTRWQGVILLVAYAAYTVSLFR